MGLLDKIKNAGANIAANGAANLIEKVGTAVDSLITSKEEAETLKIEMAKVVNEHEAAMATIRAEERKNEDNQVSERWKADASSDSKLAKITRPLVMLSLLTFLFFIIITDSIKNIQFDVKSEYVALLSSLLLTTVVAYFGSRGVEKFQKIKESKK